MKKLKHLMHFVVEMFKRIDNDSVYAVSGHATLFIIISFFPFIMLLLSAVKYMPFTEQQVLELFSGISPGTEMSKTITTAVSEVFARSGSVALSITAITLVWSASTSIYSVTLGLNRVYNHKETRNYFLVRGISILYTVVFVVAILMTLVLMVFGNSILEALAKAVPFMDRFGVLFNLARQIVAFIILLLIFDLLYTLIPNRRSRMIFELPGALIAALGWYVYSYFYSIYIQNFSNVSYVYGSLTAVVLLMIWLYFCMYIFFVGAEINQIAEENGWCRKRRKKFNEKLESIMLKRAEKK